MDCGDPIIDSDFWVRYPTLKYILIYACHLFCWSMSMISGRGTMTAGVYSEEECDKENVINLFLINLLY
jgi:hypothetical protein